MPRVLILSSYVAASRVGGSAQAVALARLGIEPVLIPTVLFGRHPGWGAPGGAAVAAETMAGMLEGVEGQGFFPQFDALICGYFADQAQVALAARTIDTLRAARAGVRVVVDPIMGDEGVGLYVRAAVAEAIAADLVPRAGLVTPNAWELERLTGAKVTNPSTAVAAAARLGKPALVSSVRAGAEIGVVYADAGRGWLAAHALETLAPKGTGDLLSAYFTAALIQRLALHDALQAAVGAVAELAGSAGFADPEVGRLPIRLGPSARVRLEAVHG